MGVEIEIKDGTGTNGKAKVLSTKEHGPGLGVYAYEGIPLGFQSAFFTNPTYGADLNQDATVGGTPDIVHDGTDTTKWTATALSGTWDFASTSVAHAGTKSVDGTGANNNSEAQFAKGSDLTIADYVSLTGWIYITRFDTRGTKHINIYGWDTGTVSQVSATLNIDDYVDTNTLGSWQQFSIPFADFGFTSPTLDAIRIKNIDIGGGPAPDFYLDDIQFEESGGSIIFSVGPEIGEIWRITSLTYTMVDAYAGTLADATMPNIPYDGFLSLGPLAIGSNIRRIQFGEAQFTATFKNLIDYINTPAPKVIASGSDGTNTWLRLEANFPHPIIFDGTKGDKYEFIVNDDLSGLTFYKGSVAYGEVIPYTNK